MTSVKNCTLNISSRWLCRNYTLESLWLEVVSFRLGPQKVTSPTENSGTKQPRFYMLMVVFQITKVSLPPAVRKFCRQVERTIQWTGRALLGGKNRDEMLQSADRLWSINQWATRTKPQYKQDLTARYVQLAQFIKISKVNMAYSTALALIDTFPVVKRRSFRPRSSSSSPLEAQPSKQTTNYLSFNINSILGLEEGNAAAPAMNPENLGRIWSSCF